VKDRRRWLASHENVDATREKQRCVTATAADRGGELPTTKKKKGFCGEGTGCAASKSRRRYVSHSRPLENFVELKGGSAYLRAAEGKRTSSGKKIESDARSARRSGEESSAHGGPEKKGGLGPDEKDLAREDPRSNSLIERCGGGAIGPRSRGGKNSACGSSLGRRNLTATGGLVSRPKVRLWCACKKRKMTLPYEKRKKKDRGGMRREPRQGSAVADVRTVTPHPVSKNPPPPRETTTRGCEKKKKKNGSPGRAPEKGWAECLPRRQKKSFSRQEGTTL